MALQYIFTVVLDISLSFHSFYNKSPEHFCPPCLFLYPHALHNTLFSIVKEVRVLQ